MNMPEIRPTPRHNEPDGGFSGPGQLDAAYEE